MKRRKRKWLGFALVLVFLAGQACCALHGLEHHDDGPPCSSERCVVCALAQSPVLTTAVALPQVAMVVVDRLPLPALDDRFEPCCCSPFGPRAPPVADLC